MPGNGGEVGGAAHAAGARLRAMAGAVAELDVLGAFAEAARRYDAREGFADHDFLGHGTRTASWSSSCSSRTVWVA